MNEPIERKIDSNLSQKQIDTLSLNELIYGGKNVLNKRSIKKGDRVIIINDENNCAFVTPTEFKLWISYQSLIVKLGSIDKAISLDISQLSSKDKNLTIGLKSTRQIDDKYIDKRFILYRKGINTIVYHFDDSNVDKYTGFNISNDKGFLKSFKDFKYATPYYISKSSTSNYLYSLEAGKNVDYPLEFSKTIKQTFSFWPYMDQTPLPKSCLYTDWSKIVNKLGGKTSNLCGPSPEDLINKCIPDIIKFCGTTDKKGVRLFDGYCKDAILALQKIIGSEDSRNLNKMMLDTCIKYPFEKECACLYPLALAYKNKKFVAKDKEIQFPHCNVKECIEDTEIYRTKEQKEWNCASVVCKVSIKNLDEKAAKNVNVIQVCSSKNTPDSGNINETPQDNSPSSIFIVLFLIALIIVIVVVIYNNFNKNKRKKLGNV